MEKPHQVNAECISCSFKGNIEVKKGKKIYEMSCSECGNKTLRKSKMKCKIIDCQPMDRGFKYHRGTDGVPGYDFRITCNSEEYAFNVSASKTFLGGKGITKKEDYKRICLHVIKRGVDLGLFDEIKEKWQKNRKEGFALVTTLNMRTDQGKVDYGPSWKEPKGWLFKVITFPEI